jgi:hypothetical protein
MRLFAALAAAAALSLSAPAAAQPDPAQILREALEQAHRNAPDEVRDYIVTVSSGPLRTELYVWRENYRMYVQGRDWGRLGGMLEAMAMWPALGRFNDPASLEWLGSHARYESAETVDGRRAHVVTAPLRLQWNVADLPDTTRVYVDAPTRQVLRIAAAGPIEEGEGPMGNGGHNDVAITFGDYRATGGVTVPRRIRFEMHMRLDLDDAERAQMRRETDAAIAQQEALGEDGWQAAFMLRQTRRMLEGEAMVIEAVIEDVRVNTGRPDWFK